MRKTQLSVLGLALTLVGCAQQMLLDDASAQLRAGNFETAIQAYQQGVSKYPDSVPLRAGLTSAKSEAIARLVAQAAQFRAAGQINEAERVIQRALALEPKSDRLLAIQTDLAVERRAQLRLDEANALVAAKKRDAALRVVEAALKESPRQTDLVALQRKLEAEIRLEGDGGRRSLAETRPITLDFRNAPLSVVLEAITRGSGVNFVLDRDVRQDNRVTIYLRSARVEDAIDLLASSQQLARRTVDAQTVLIYPNTPEKQKEHQEQVIRVFHLGSADAKTTSALLRSMLRIKEPFVDEKANLIAIREAPEIVALAERLVALHDVGDAEVMLEVEVLEIKTSRLTELGINFPNSLTLTPLAPTGASGLTVNNLRSINSDRVGVSVSNLLINLRREVGDFNTLANPRIRAKNREKARILIGDKIPIITSTSSASGFVSETVNYQDVGLKLDVEPLVSPDDDVTIKLALEVSTLGTPVKSAGGSIAYQIGTRNANTTLRLRDGETQLLGGLISNEDRSSANRVPGLGDLPVAGRLFSSQLDNFNRTELVLAITPRILRSNSRPDISQAELWVGTESATRLQAAPARRLPVSSPALSATSAGAGQSQNSVPEKPSQTTAAPIGPIRASWQGPSEAKVGEDVTLTLNLSSATPLRGIPLEIAFSPQLVEVLDVSEGGFFKQSDGVTSFTHSVNSQTGRLGVGILRSDTTGASGQASLLQVKIKVRAPGVAELSVKSINPIGLGGPTPTDELPVFKLTVK